jgi:hypothetical protein
MQYDLNKKRGSNVAIDRELAGNIENPSFDVINYAINQQQKRIDRYNMLEHYYEGNQHILSRNLEMAAKLDRADEKVMTNHAKYITDMITGFTTGNPISISPANGKDIKAITDAQDQMEPPNPKERIYSPPRLARLRYPSETINYYILQNSPSKCNNFFEFSA